MILYVYPFLNCYIYSSHTKTFRSKKVLFTKVQKQNNNCKLSAVICLVVIFRLQKRV